MIGKSGSPARVGWRVTWWVMGLCAVIGGVLMLPIHAVGSPGWDLAYQVHDNFAELIGWPEPISGINPFWAREYGDPPPEQLIVLGFSLERLAQFFETCTLARQTPNPNGVQNEETMYHPDIFVCKGLRMPWEGFWEWIRVFG